MMFKARAAGALLLAASCAQGALSEALRRRSACTEVCEIEGESLACKEHILEASMSDFLGDPNSCDLARKAVAGQCEVCGECPLHEVGCGIMEWTTTSGKPTTTIHLDNACDAVCTLAGQDASCTDRIRWTADNVFTDKPMACHQAHESVLRECSVCGPCTVKGTGCKDEETRSGKPQPFDCQKGEDVEWSEEKKRWCCDEHQQACDLISSHRHIFFQKSLALKTGLNAAIKRWPLAAASTVAAFAIVSGFGLRWAYARLARRGTEGHVALLPVGVEGATEE